VRHRLKLPLRKAGLDDAMHVGVIHFSHTAAQRILEKSTLIDAGFPFIEAVTGKIDRLLSELRRGLFLGMMGLLCPLLRSCNDLLG
jgi:hypothetical protein